MISELKRSWRRIIFGIVRTIHSGEHSNNPAYLGRTFAVGFFGGMFVPYGQSLICIAIWLVVDRIMHYRFNVVLSCLATLISNPLTTPFWFYLFYLTGQELLGGHAMAFSDFTYKLGPILSGTSEGGFVAGLTLLMKGIGIPILIGSLPWHLIMIPVGYFFGVWVYREFHKLLAYRREKKNEARRVSLAKHKTA